MYAMCVCNDDDMWSMLDVYDVPIFIICHVRDVVMNHEDNATLLTRSLLFCFDIERIDRIEID
jgi:hypothetical protein